MFHPYQSGFRPNHSCQTALIRLYNSWLEAIDKREIVGTVFLDLRKAFDLVDHSLLVKKLQFYLQSASAVHFFSSYLSGRTQKTFVNGRLSSADYVTFGVPQGSILGPILFCMFINDLPLHLRHKDNVSLDLFCDDSSLSAHNRSIVRLQRVLQDSINDVSLWCVSNRMVLHPHKSKCMVITTRQKHQLCPLRLNLSINSAALEQVKVHRLLGVLIDEKLTWHPHIDFVLKKVSRNLFLLTKLYNVISPDAMKMFFYAHCLSHINYASSVWCNTDFDHLKN